MALIFLLALVLLIANRDAILSAARVRLTRLGERCGEFALRVTGDNRRVTGLALYAPGV